MISRLLLLTRRKRSKRVQQFTRQNAAIPFSTSESPDNRGEEQQQPIQIGNVQIHFPYVPYECQRDYMAKVVHAVDTGTNAALESPTGTGKTLSLLCATCAWLLERKRQIMEKAEDNMSTRIEGMPKIYYASRTHDQLRQVVREMNKSKYKCEVKVATLASRDHLCLNWDVQRSENKVEMCHAKARKRMCQFHREFEGFTRDQRRMENIFNIYGANGKAMNLDDIRDMAKRHGHCPFYIAREMGKMADLVLLPYNYLLDPEVRQRFSINLKGNILIFDEAHNLEAASERSMSVDLSTETVSKALDELWTIKDMFGGTIKQQEGEKEENALTKLYGLLKRLLRQIESIDLKKGGIGMDQLSGIANIHGRVFPGNKMIELVEAAGISRKQRLKICTQIDQICTFLASQADKNKRRWYEGGTRLPISRGVGLAQIGVLISRVFMDTSEGEEQSEENEFSKHFKLYAVEKLTEDGKKYIQLHYCCLNAGVAMRYLQSLGTQSILLASGTLAPLDTFLTSMGIQFGSVLESGHCARTGQLIVGALRRGPNNSHLLGTFLRRNETIYKQAVGELILQLARITPQGMLIFFSSYSQMANFVEYWRETESTTTQAGGQPLFNQLERKKRIFIEPRDKADIPTFFREFDAATKKGGGALLLAVCRGKLSEGIDFADRHCRSLVIVGIPFPPMYDPRILLKKAHLAEQAKLMKNATKMTAAILSPDHWYRIQGTRAFNQALGRIIRHKDDFGAAILADSRYVMMNPQMFPTWMRQSIKIHTTPDPLVTSIHEFFVERGFPVECSAQNGDQGGSDKMGDMATDEINTYHP